MHETADGQNDGKGVQDIRVSLSALSENYRLLNTYDPRVRVMAVVKADAYGHGLLPCAQALYQAGARDFAVASPEEGESVRTVAPHARILLLSPTPPNDLFRLVRARLIQSVGSLDYLKALISSSLPLSVHIALDAGMSRYGFSLHPRALSDSVAAWRLLLAQKTLHVDGVYAHLSSSDHPASPRTETELARFDAALRLLRQMGFRGEAHLANSAAHLRALCHYPIARCGIALYGYPSCETDLPLRPILVWKTYLAECKEICAGESVGYGAGTVVREPAQIGVLPVGYADGLPREAVGASVLLPSGHGVIAARVMMNATVLFLPAGGRAGDEVTLYDPSGETLRDIACHAGTIPYTLLTSLSPRIPRRYEP